VLVRREEGRALAIGQLSHSWLSGQLAREWGNARFDGVEPREEIALGAEQHDIGWALFDLDPKLSPDTGLPRSFLELSVEEHLAIWRGAPERLLSQSLHAALVVSMHGSSLSELRAHNDPGQAPLLQAHIDEERERQRSLSAVLGVSPDQAARTRRQMWTWDGLSLALCNAWRPFVAREVPGVDGLVELELRDGEDGTSTLDPWPFAAAELTVRCEARELAPSYEHERAMRDALKHAKPITLEFSLRRAD
jgi:Protein of unknown function (DUF3891)